jgi:hypothetical protein
MWDPRFAWKATHEYFTKYFWRELIDMMVHAVRRHRLILLIFYEAGDERSSLEENGSDYQVTCGTWI